MDTALILIVRALGAGALVVVFAVLGEKLRPQSLAGVLAAAPSIALASLVVLVIARGSRDAAAEATGMIVGAAAMCAAALVAVDAVRRFRALRGSAVAIAAWLGVAAVVYGVVLR